jgi:hypothetical protein
MTARGALVVTTKGREADSLVAVLSSAKTSSPSCWLRPSSDAPGIRGSIEGARGSVEIWCVEELMRVLAG